MTILYVNHGIDKRCGVYGFGVRHYNSIKSSRLDIRYVEINTLHHFYEACHQHAPTAIIFNYMPVVMPWVSPDIAAYPAKRFAIHHTYDSHSISWTMNEYQAAGLFDYMLIPDPSLAVSDPRIKVIPRPMFMTSETVLTKNPIPQIGTFGFALPSKQIPVIAAEINRCFSKAVFNLHMPEAFFNGMAGANRYTEMILQQCHEVITKPGITINYTNDFLDDSEVIEMLSKNDINALFYNLPPNEVGRSSAIDYMIAARRPILTTACDSFNHAEKYLPVFPKVTFSTIMRQYGTYKTKAKDLYLSLTKDIVEETDQILESIL